MNWIATAFEALKVKFESHVTHVNTSLTDLATRVEGAEAYVKSAVSSAESRIATLESVTVQGVENRVKALELRAAEALKAYAP